MVKEPNTKLDNIHENVTNELLHAGIIDDKNNILDQKAFLKFIEMRKQKLQPQLDAAEKDGVVIDQYAFNLLSSEMQYLEDMQEQMSVNPSHGSAYPTKDSLDSYFKKQEQKKEQRVAQGNWLHRIFGRNK